MPNPVDSAAPRDRSHKPRKRVRQAAKLVGIVGLVGSVALGVSGLIAKRRCDSARAQIAATATFFDRDGQKIRYDLQGEGNPGPTIVLLSGFVGSLEQWNEVQPALTGVAPVLTYDRGGYGLSDPPPGADAVAQADELADLAGAKSVKLPLVVVGFSSSAFIARAFAQRHAPLLGGLVFLDATDPEHVLAGSREDSYRRHVIYERVPFITLAKRLVGFQSGVGERGAVATPAELRAAQLLNFPSHWWAGYREGAAIQESARQAHVDWQKLHVPVTVVSLADPAGSEVSRRAYRLHARLAEESGGEFVHPSGFGHSAVHHDDAFVPHIVSAVAGVVQRVRSSPGSRIAAP